MVRLLLLLVGLLASGPCLSASPSPSAPGPDDALFSAVLRDHVHNDQVDYRNLQKDPRLATYLAQLAATDPAALPSRDAQLAFWINAYNAYTLKLVLSVYPVDSIRQITALGRTGDPASAKPWDIALAQIGDRTYTLEQIEHTLIRAQFKDARVHFALVCAAVSCPKLRHEAYTAEKLEDQLEDQGRWFLSQRNQLDGRKRTAHLSAIFEWFASDFGGKPTNLLDFIASYATPDLAPSLRRNPADWKIESLDYDWRLNDRR